MWGCHLSVNDGSNFFAESNNSFKKLEEYFLTFGDYSQCKSYRRYTFKFNLHGYSAFSPLNETINQTLICTVFQFQLCKYCHHCRFQATKKSY